MKKELLIGIAIGAGAVAMMTGVSAPSLLFGALILVCPLMMVFMMAGHGHGVRNEPTRTPEDRGLPTKKD